MKKALMSALTTGLVVGASATTFAAANPFSDLPADHWAYDAVTQLAQDGVVEGYGDTTFRGDRNITRYEMAQMFAKLMAKDNWGATDKALLDKLAAEFSEELNNLGVRVANLERNADMVKWTGELRYQYWSDRTDKANGNGKTKSNRDRLRFRLNPVAEVNDHWKVKARIQADTFMDTDSGKNRHRDTNTSRDKLSLAMAYAEGVYGKWTFDFGKMPLWSDWDEGMTFDDYFSGFAVTYGSKVKVKVEAGRWNAGSAANGITMGNYDDNAANYQGIEVNYSAKKLNLGASFRHLDSKGLQGAYVGNVAYSDNDDADDAKIWGIGGRYTFDKNFSIQAAFAQNTEADNLDTSHNIEMNYKGAKKNAPGSWGVYAAYRYLSPFVSFAPTQNTFAMNPSKKGWEVGATYTPFKNVVTTLSYFNGKKLGQSDIDTETMFGYVRIYF